MEMAIVKQGSLYMQYQQRFGKKWKKVWGILHGGTSGQARIELYEGSKPPEHGRRPECWRLLQLSDCVSVSERNGETSPKDTRSFTIETTQRIYLLACETYEQPCWIKALCSIAFPQEHQSLERRCSQPSQAGRIQLQENLLYSSSRERGNYFEVRVRNTEASSRCGLSGIYTLTVESSNISLRDHQTGNLLYSWPYPFLRRFGRDKTMFSFEAGRRCRSGEGNFEFETSQGGQIFQAIESAINSSNGSTSTSSGQTSSSDESTSGTQLPQRSILFPALSKSNSNPPPSSKGRSQNLSPLEESEYSVPFDKVAHSLMASGFGRMMGPSLSVSEEKGMYIRRVEHIYDEPETPHNPVYDEPEGVRVEAWRTQATDAHDAGYEYPYLPGWDDYAVPRVGEAVRVGNLQDGDDEWGKQGKKEREYDNVTLRGKQ